jgi:hypothetical protein
MPPSDQTAVLLQRRVHFRADLDPARRQLGMHARHPVDPARLAMDSLDLPAQLHVRASAEREGPLAPRVVPAGGDTQDAAHGGDRMDGLVCRHELESLDGA